MGIHRILPVRRLAALFLFSLCVGLAHGDVLDDYVKRLRRDAAGERKETGFLSAGSDFLYGQDYFESGNATSAVWYFRDAAKKDPKNPFFHYQLAAALLKMGDKNVVEDAQEHLATAIQLQPALRARAERELAGAGKDQRPPAADAPAPIANPAPANANSVEDYIARLRRSRAIGGPETAMNTPGQEALYGFEYYERNQFDSAESRFRMALARDANNPYLNYLMGVTLAAQGKDANAAPHLQRAFAGDPALRARYDAELAGAQAAWQKIVEAKQPKTTPATPAAAPGGALVYGNYTCHETIWNGPNRVPAFRSEYRGYFELKSDGTYRWLDNGETGRYRYDSQTGVVTWLSGRFAGGGAPQSTVYRREGASGAMTISFSDNLRWNAFREVK